MAGGFIGTTYFVLILEYYVESLLKWGGGSKFQVVRLKTLITAPLSFLSEEEAI